MYAFGLWEEARLPGENFMQLHGENPHSKNPASSNLVPSSSDVTVLSTEPPSGMISSNIKKEIIHFTLSIKFRSIYLYLGVSHNWLLDQSGIKMLHIQSLFK